MSGHEKTRNSGLGKVNAQEQDCRKRQRIQPGRETVQMEPELVMRPSEIGQIIGIGRNYRREDLGPEDYPAVP